VEDKEFCGRFREVKDNNKMKLLKSLEREFNLSFNPNFMLDCQVKRFHEYKRQLLNIFHIITLYNRIREGRVDDTFSPRVIMFSGKSAPGYFLCKLIIKLIHNVTEVVAAHPLVRDKLEVIFVPNYGVTLAQLIMPAAELSEQISTAGYEASGTGNMKFALNGALTIGTYDGANIEIREEVGEDNFFLFGLNPEEIFDARINYNPAKYIEQNKELSQIMDQFTNGFFSPENPGLFQPIVDSILSGDKYCVLADYASFIECQEKVSQAYNDQEKWDRMAILNVARSGKFSSDRAISEYAKNIWHIAAVNI